MAKYSTESRQKLATCHEDIQKVFMEVIKHFDCTILQGHRGKFDQNQFYAEGKTQVKWPNSNHNKTPSLAVDAIPYPIDWGDRERITYFAGHVIGIAATMGIDMRWGGNWDMDDQLSDNDFDDLVHFELEK